MSDITPPMDSGKQMHEWAQALFPICRSITGDGVRKTLSFLQGILPDLTLHEVPTGTQAFDWVVPDEWNIRDAFVADEHGNRLIDFNTSNLSVVNYSEPVEMTVTKDELETHLYSLPAQPNAIPYVTSYYQRRWGFCVTETQRRQLGNGPFHVKIDSTLAPGSLTYGELVIPGQSTHEIMFSTYVCHPSLANNELSGPVVTAALARWISNLPQRRYTYRFVFIPETIGSLVYMSRHLEHLKSHVKAGWVVTCVGDDRAYSFLPSRTGMTLADRISQHVLSHEVERYDRYSFLERGSDERQYCSPRADLPFASIMRSMYGTYPEYHTSLDDLDFVTPTGLAGALHVLAACVKTAEANYRYITSVVGEPQLGRRGLYPTISYGDNAAYTRSMTNVLAYADGRLDLIALADTVGDYALNLVPIVSKLREEALLEIARERT